MKKVLNILQWCLGIFFILLAFGIGFHFSAVLMFIAAILIMPIKPIRNFFKIKLRIKSIAAVILSIILFFGAIFLLPDTELSNIDDLTVGITENTSNLFEEHPTTTNNEIIADKETEKNSPTTSAAQSTTSNKDSSTTTSSSNGFNSSNANISLSDIPTYSGKAYIAINDNKPYFTSSDYTTKSYEHYSPLDSLGRCGVAIACIGQDIMPTEERGSIGMVKPTGWHTVKYDFVDGKYLYNRCHLIGFQLTGENANTRNLITGTRYLNVDGMLPFENMVDDYIEETGNHVLYRVTPIFKGDELVARGVTMEAWSVEDNGDGICFNVYCYNNQPGVEIDYATGDSWISNNTTKETTTQKAETTTKKNETTTRETNTDVKYVLNTNSMKFHYPTCGSVKQISDKNYAESNKSRDQLIKEGYTPCGNCDP